MPRPSLRLSLGELLAVVAILAMLFALMATAMRRAGGPPRQRIPAHRLEIPEPIHANSRTEIPSGP